MLDVGVGRDSWYSSIRKRKEVYHPADFMSPHHEGGSSSEQSMAVRVTLNP